MTMVSRTTTAAAVTTRALRNTAINIARGLLLVDDDEDITCTGEEKKMDHEQQRTTTIESMTNSPTIAERPASVPIGASASSSTTSSVSSTEPTMLDLENVAPSDELSAENDTASSPTPSTRSSDYSPTNGGLKVLFLSSDTGGGHRASAESLAKQFQLLFPGTTYTLLDVVEEDFGPPFNSLVSLYKHLSAHPTQWKLLYTVSNSRGFEMLADAHFKICFERAIRRSILKYNPDVVVSVHPMMTNVPVLSCRKIGLQTGRHLPMFTVVTDLGSAHCLWFANGVEKMFVGSEQVKALAKARGKVDDEKIVMAGLPIRHDFAVQAERLGDRMSPAGRAYQQYVRGPEVLDLPCVDRKTLLVMGGGEGVGSLSMIVDALYVELVSQGIDALILVVCGRNEKLKKSLDERDWVEVLANWNTTASPTGMSSKLSYRYLRDSCGESIITPTAGCIQGPSNVTGSIHRILSSSTLGLGTMSLGSMSLGNMMTTPAPEDSLKRQSSNPTSSASAPSLLDDAATTTAPAVVEEKKAEEPTVAQIETADSILADVVGPVDIEDQLSNTISVLDSLKGKTPGQVHVMGLGFVNRMAEYMVAADVLISKAGPGTISEAAALSLPVMLTSFLPGQEEGNIDFVTEAGFGAYVHDSDPIGIAEEVCMWLTDDDVRANLCKAARAKGMPHAARDIVQEIGDITLKWRAINAQKGASPATKVEAAAVAASTTELKEKEVQQTQARKGTRPVNVRSDTL